VGRIPLEGDSLMPVVPSPSVPSVAPTANTGVGYQSTSASPDAFGAQVGVATQRLGAQVEQTSDVLAKHAMKMQDDVNASIAKDLFLQGDVEVGKLTVDYNSLQGLDRVNAYDQYVKDIEGVRNRLKAEAPNGAVARQFDQDFARRVGYSIVDGARGAATENKKYQNQTNAAVRANTMSHIAANAQDDLRFNNELKIGLETFQRDDEYRGASPEVREQRDRAYTTEAWATRLQSIAKTDPIRARELLKENGGKLDGGKVLQLKDVINQQIINVDTRVSSDKIIQSGALVPPDLREAVKRFEGYSDKPYSDFKQTSSGYGTKAQPGDENIPPEQRRAVFEQRLDNELARAANIVDQFAPGLPAGTRKALISLTYNAGSAWTSAGLGQSIRAGDTEKAREIFQQYNRAGGEMNDALVARRAQEAAWWGGEARETDPVNQLTEAMNAAKERAIQVFPDDPANQARYLDSLQSRIRADQSVMQSAARQMQLDQRNAVQKELVNDQSVTSYDRLSPAAKQAYDLSPPSQQDVFNRQMRKNATADVPLTADRQNLYDKLRGMATTSPDTFMGVNVTELDLPRPQKSKLAELQVNRQALVEKGIRSQGIMKDSQALLNDAGIRPSTSDTTMNQNFMKFKGVLDQQVEAFMSENKRAPTPKEGREMVTQLTREIVTSEGWLWNSRVRGFEAIADKTPIEPPSGVDFATHYATIPRGATYRAPDGQLKVKR
jgi:GH24 family phage-related lysozyme (muramidase)